MPILRKAINTHVSAISSVKRGLATNQAKLGHIKDHERVSEVMRIPLRAQLGHSRAEHFAITGEKLRGEALRQLKRDTESKEHEIRVRKDNIAAANALRGFVGIAQVRKIVASGKARSLKNVKRIWRTGKPKK